MAVCIPKELIDSIKNLNLKGMTSLERIKELSSFLGEDTARNVNLDFEKSLLLKNQKTAFNKFVDNISGMSLEKKAALKEKLAQRVADKNTKINNDELLSIIKETLDKKYDLEIPEEQVKKMLSLKKEADKLSEVAKGTPDGSDAKLRWGNKIVEYSEVVDDMKQVSTGVMDDLKMAGTRIADKVRDGDILGTIGQTTKELVDLTFTPTIKSIKASWDNSVILRQGLKVMSADPKTWKNRTGETLKLWSKVFNKEEMTNMARAFKADMVTRDLYQTAMNSKLAIGVVEDYFPTHFTEKIPGLGNFFQASNEAFSIFSQGSRMDLFEKWTKAFQNANGGSMPSKEILDGFASVANSTTGRGGLGKLEASASFWNKIFFSLRFQKAQIDTLTNAFNPSLPKEVRDVAAKNLAKHLVLMGGVMTTMSAFTDVGWDPRESTFGKVRMPGTKKWIDVTGNLASYPALIGRMTEKLTGKAKFGDSTAMDVIMDFMKGKLAPVPGAVRDYFEKRDFDGNVPTVASTIKNIFVPITLDNIYKDVKDDEETSVTALSAFFDAIGASSTEPKSQKSEGSYKSPLDLFR